MTPEHCRLCSAPLSEDDAKRGLCAVCDEYAQHVALQSNERFERVLGALPNAAAFVRASKSKH